MQYAVEIEFSNHLTAFLPFTYYLLRTVYCLLSTAYFILPAAYVGTKSRRGWNAGSSRS